MSVDTQILNHTKRNATMIVKRKPSDAEGVNGDIATGNTAEGPMLFAKIGNRWKSFKPKSIPARKNATFAGSLHLNTKGIFYQYDSSWIPLGTSFTTNPRYDQYVNKNGNHNERFAMLIPYNAKIKKLTARSISVLGDTTVRLFVLNDGSDDWDTNDTHASALTPSSASSSYAIEATTDIASANKEYEFFLDDTYIIPKHSLIGLWSGTTNTGQDTVWQLHLEFHE